MTNGCTIKQELEEVKNVINDIQKDEKFCVYLATPKGKHDNKRLKDLTNRLNTRVNNIDELIKSSEFKKKDIEEFLKPQFPDGNDVFAVVDSMADDELDLAMQLTSFLGADKGKKAWSDKGSPHKNFVQKVYRPQEVSCVKENLSTNLELTNEDQNTLKAINYKNFDMMGQFSSIGYTKNESGKIAEFRMIHPIIDYLIQSYQSPQSMKDGEIEHTQFQPGNVLDDDKTSKTTKKAEACPMKAMNLLFLTEQKERYDVYKDNKQNIDKVLEKVAQCHNNTLHIMGSNGSRNGLYDL